MLRAMTRASDLLPGAHSFRNRRAVRGVRGVNCAGANGGDPPQHNLLDALHQPGYCDAHLVDFRQAALPSQVRPLCCESSGVESSRAET